MWSNIMMVQSREQVAMQLGVSMLMQQVTSSVWVPKERIMPCSEEFHSYILKSEPADSHISFSLIYQIFCMITSVSTVLISSNLIFVFLKTYKRLSVATAA